ncbi:hypothetical protein [Catenuloplanes japonicus]|uniref:hypothetical protein n=1 Tax=Catenuloplanes japonicus TaxID=33876 RepID=UPI0005257683|nr:hypothetical protein [Catenuloplanes japonicus]
MATFFPYDPPLKARIISALSAHADGCQDGDCTWCDNLIVQAEAVIAVLAGYPPDVLQEHLRDASGRDRAAEPGS